MKKFLETLKVYGVVLLLAALIFFGTLIDYKMFKRSHPQADFISYLWERGQSD